MRKTTQRLAGLLGLGVLAVLAVVLLVLFRNVPQRLPTGQAVSPIQTPPPTVPTAVPTRQPTPTFQPTPTIPPVPTPLPTPVVTPIPVAKPPFIPLPPGEVATSYTLVLRDGDVLRAISSDGTNERILVDIHAQVPLFLAGRSAGVMPFQWGQLSPDGSQLALVLSNAQQKSQSTAYSIYLYDLATERLRLLVENGVEPVWSPDGTRIAYRGIRVENYGQKVAHSLRVVDVATGMTKELVTVDANDTGVTFFTWSPDSQRIAFTKTVAGYISAGEIWVVDAAGNGKAAQITPMEMYAVYLNWSPAGDQILFISDSGEHVTPGRPLSLWTVEVETGRRRQLTQNITISGGTPIWSSDGNWIAFTGTNLLEGGELPYDLWLVASDGSTLRRLTNDPASDLYPTWASDSQIIFLKRGSGIWEIDLGDGTSKQIYYQDSEYKVLR